MARYKLMGRVIEGVDANTAPMTRDEQNALPIEEVYETNDLTEASEIQRRGGFFRKRDEFVSVTSVIDTADSAAITGGEIWRKQGSADAQPMPQKGE